MPATKTFEYEAIDSHGKRAKGNKPNDPSMNMLYCDGHADTVGCREAYRSCRWK